MKVKKIIFAGDSVTVGMGCTEPAKSAYSWLVSDHYQAEMINLARPSASMYAIYLQAMYGVQKLSGNLVIFNTTSIDRIEWISDTADYDGELDASHVMEWAPHIENDYEYYFKGKPEYNPIIFSETVAFLHYVQGQNHPKLVDESTEKIKTILDYTAIYRDDRIHMEYCEALVLSTYVRLKKMGVPCLFLLHGRYRHMADLVDYSVEVDFFELGRQMPGLDGYHTNEQGQKIAAQAIIDAIDEYELI